MPFSIEFSDQSRDDAWDEFVESLPDGHHEQTSLWGQVRTQNGWGISRVLVREKAKIVAGVQMQIRPVKRFGKMAYVTHGPCLRGPDPVLEQAVIEGMKQNARLKHVNFMVVGLPYDGHFLEPGFKAAGFLPKPARIHPHVMQATAVINLSLESDQIFSAMQQSKRRNVRHALKRGIQVTEQNGDGLREFHKLMCTLCQRRKTTPNPARAEFFMEIWQRFQPKGWVKLFCAMHGSEPVAAAMAFTFGDWFRVWKVGWSGQHGNLKPNDALWWHMIVWAQRHGYRFFDFVDIDPEEARRMANGGVNPESAESVTSFKLAFGAECVFLPSAYYYVLNPVWRKLFHHGVGRWLDSPVVLKVVDPFLRKMAHSQN